MTSYIRPGLVAAWLMAGIIAGQSAELLLEYTFNGAGTQTETSQRSAWDWPLEFQAQDGSPADWHGSPGSGVSGRPADRAFDNTASTDMGSAAEGGRAYAHGRSVAPLESLTLSGWFRTESKPIGAFARLFFWGGDNQVYAWPEASLSISVAFRQNVSSDPVYTEIDEWIFFAVTFDSTASEDNVLFYKGALDQPATLVSTRSLAAGEFPLGNKEFSLGNSYVHSVPTQPFDGWLDNFRLHGGSGSSGVLTLEELETLRAADVNGVLPQIRVRVQLEVEPNEGPPPGLTFRYSTLLGQNYRVQQSLDLVNWTDLAESSLSGNGATQQWTMSPLPVTSAFYRLKVTQED